MNINLTLPAEPFSGQIVTFKAPCDSKDVTNGLFINGEIYTICDAAGKCVTAVGNAWSNGAQVSVILDCATKKAYIQNANTSAYLEAQFGSKTGSHKTVAGKEITIGNAPESVLHGLKLYGKSTQDGTPTPESPVEIVSAGANGEIGVAVRGTNLWDGEILYPKNATELTTTWNNNGSGVVTLGAIRIKASSEDVLGKGAFISFVSDSDVGVNAVFQFVSENNANWSQNIYVPIKRGYNEVVMPAYSFEEGQTSALLQIRKKANEPEGSWTFTLNDFFITAGKNALSYEPCMGTLSALTPNGLLGFKVTSGGNYTDSTGQQWVADVIDCAQGVRVQNIGQIASYKNEEILGEYMSTTGELSEGATVLYSLPEPIITPLTDEELIGYSSLHTYVPKTNISNTDGVDMEVSYYLPKAALPVSGGTMGGPIHMANHRIMGLGEPVSGTDAVNKKYVTDNFVEDFGYRIATNDTDEAYMAVIEDCLSRMSGNSISHVCVDACGERRSVLIHRHRVTEGYANIEEVSYATTESGNAYCIKRVRTLYNGVWSDWVTVTPADFGYTGGTISTEEEFMAIIDNCLDRMPRDSVRHVSIMYYGRHSVTIHKHLEGYAYIEDATYVYSAKNGAIGNKLRNILYDGVWMGWEYENPPMVSGVEYRTTERYNGKAVYVQLVDFGVLPNKAPKSVEVITSRLPVTNIVSYETLVKTPDPFVGHRDMVISLSDGYMDICMNAEYDESGNTAMVLVKYTLD